VRTRGEALSVALALAVLLSALVGCSAQTRGAGGAQAEEQSNRPVDLVVPFGPGGGADQLARITAPSMEKDLGAQVPVVNTEGATGSTGMTSMLSAPPGEATAVLIQDTLATVAAGSASFEPGELQGVCRLQEMPSGLFVKGDGPFADWDELAAAAKERPGELKVATVGEGSADDVMLAALAQQGIEFRTVPFADPNERYNALLGGAVDVLYEQPGDVLPNLESGQFKTVLVFSDKPVDGLEGDPVLSSEVGVDVILNQFRGLVTSKEASPETVESLSNACSMVQDDEKFTKFQKSNFSMPGSYMNSEEFDKYLDEQLDQIESLGRRYGVN
jgi:tripartite-type tricarboxylate transporter receptor subunit TctC